MKILVALETCDKPKYIARRQRCLDTWVPKLKPGYDFKICTGKELGCSDEYKDLNQKTKAIVQYAFDNDYDWLLIVDDDIYIRTAKLKPPVGYDYAGMVLPFKDKRWGSRPPQPPTFCSGGCYWLSRRAIEIVASSPLDKEIPGEDNWVADVLRKQGIEPYDLYGYTLSPRHCPQCPTLKIVDDWIACFGIILDEEFETLSKWPIPVDPSRIPFGIPSNPNNDKVLVALETCLQPKYMARTYRCMTTWIPRLPPGYDFKLCTGPELGCPDDYVSLCLKTRAICRYARDKGYDWLLIVDDDTYVRTDKLTTPETGDYVGYVFPFGHGRPVAYCSGGAYWLSRKAFSILAVSPMLKITNAEDQWSGWTLANYNIPATENNEFLMQPCNCGKCVLRPAPKDTTIFMQVLQDEDFWKIADLYEPG